MEVRRLCLQARLWWDLLWRRSTRPEQLDPGLFEDFDIALRRANPAPLSTCLGASRTLEARCLLEAIIASGGRSPEMWAVIGFCDFDDTIPGTLGDLPGGGTC